jgi:hypothetical protein
LFVAGIFTNDADDVFPPHNFAAFAKAFDGCSDFHDFDLGWRDGNKELIQRLVNATGHRRAIFL